MGQVTLSYGSRWVSHWGIISKKISYQKIHGSPLGITVYIIPYFAGVIHISTIVPHCANCSKILWTTISPFGIEVLFFQHFEHCAKVRISKTIWESTIVYFIISGNASKEIPQKTYFFPILFFIFWQAINNRTSRANISDVLYQKR